MASVGYMNEISKKFEWKIAHFFPHLEEFNEYFYNGPKFLFAGESWFLALYPNGHRESNSIGFISILLFRCCSGPSLSLKFSVSLKTAEGKKDKETYCRYTFRDWGFGASHLISRAELFEKASELLPSNVLTVVFAIKHSEVVEVEHAVFSLNGTATVQCSYCKEVLDGKNRSSHEKKCMDKPMECPECCNVVVLRNWYEHECKAKNSKDYYKVLGIVFTISTVLIFVGAFLIGFCLKNRKLQNRIIYIPPTCSHNIPRNVNYTSREIPLV